MSGISQISPTNLSKYISPIRTAIDLQRENDRSKFQVEVKPNLRLEATENLKGRVVDKKV
jgi:hypothetical protein